MVQVELLVQTFYERPLKPGDVIDVTETVAVRWGKHGIARPVQEEDPETIAPPKKPKGGKKNDAE